MRVCLLLASLAMVGAADIAVATFDGAKGTTFEWKPVNDPVMGGKSTGTVTIDSADQVAVFNGTIRIIPFLGAPGVIQATATGKTNDVSSCKNLVLNVNSKADFKGYHVSFSKDSYPGTPFYQYGYKTNFVAPVGEFSDVVIPFSDFSLNWDKATGAKVTECKDDPKACVTTKSLTNLQHIAIWAQGVVGGVNLKIKSIRATDCATVV